MIMGEGTLIELSVAEFFFGDLGFDEHGFAPEVGVFVDDMGATVFWIHG